ncbi:ParB family protein [Salmonella enterica]|nr:ParB family protein [Salmonella enterica]ELW6564645.1 ParB family protein [Salmonella enterica]ELZ1405545.1 ParB family protein [Salmonella enterica]
MAKTNLLDLGTALLQGAREPQSAPSPAIMPTSEMPLILTLDEVAPNPDNPRTTRNPKYDEIKDSIRSRGLDTVPKVTKNPDIPGSPYIFSDGGNTRYSVLRELYAETGDEHFYRFHVLFKPWPGRLKCLVGHLAENDVRGDLTFIDKALGIRKARAIYEETLGRSVTLRELSELLRLEGYPIDNSLISRMEHTVKYLYPYMPELLASGLGNHQITQILALRTGVEKVWKQYNRETLDNLTSVFGEVCRQFDDPELYSIEMFRDELIGSLVKALPHPSLNYDRWLIELDPKTQNQRALFGAPEPIAEHLILADQQAWQEGDVQNEAVVRAGTQPPEPAADGDADPISAGSPGGAVAVPSPVAASGRGEIQPDIPDGPDVLSGAFMPSGVEDDDTDDAAFSSVYAQGNAGAAVAASAGVTAFSQAAGAAVTVASAVGAGGDVISGSNIFPFRDNDNTAGISAGPLMSAIIPPSSVAFADTGLEPVSDIWAIPALQDDTEHLQDMAYRLVFEIAEAMGCEDSVREDNRPGSAGFAVSPHGNEFVLFLAGLSGELPDKQFNMFLFCLNFFGSQSPSDTPVFDDIHVVKTMRLIRVIRRLRELQRLQTVTGDDGRTLQ